MNKTGKDTLMLLKDLAGAPGPQLGLKIAGFDSYFLRPIPTRRDLLIAIDITCLTNWRNRHSKAFLTEFHATEERTSKWLYENVHSDDSRILFMIEDEHCRPVGYMGIAYIDWVKSYVEADAIVSGGETPKGIMFSGLKTLMNWAKGQLGLKTVAVRVLSDNPALSFYRELGFMETRRVPLRRVDFNGFVTWTEDSSLAVTDRYLVHHLWADDNERKELPDTIKN